MSMSDTFETAFLRLVLLNEAFTGLGDSAGLLGSAAAGSLYVSLHTADPGEAGTQSTAEANYAGYARVAVTRTASGWVVTGNVGKNVAAVTFPAATGGTSTVTHIGIGTAASGAGKLLWSGALGTPASMTVTTGMAPSFAPNELTITVD